MRKNKKKLCFYIAHTFSLRYWIRDVFCPELHKLGIETINPFYHKDGSYRKERPEVKMFDDKKMTHKDIPDKIRETIVPEDLKKIKQAKSGIIAYMKKPSVGTSMEIFFCARDLGRDVFLVTDNDRLYYHPWFIFHCKKIFRSKKALYAYLKEMKKLE